MAPQNRELGQPHSASSSAPHFYDDAQHAFHIHPSAQEPRVILENTRARHSPAHSISILMASSESGTSSSSDPTQPLAVRPALLRKSGHLYKRTGVVRSWKPRYFSLEGTVLYYFKREGDAQPKGIVVLTGCHVTRTHDKKFYSFRIAHPHTSKVYDLAATLQSRTQDWIDALEHAAQLMIPSSSSVPSLASLTRSTSASSSTSNSGSRTRASTMGMRSSLSSGSFDAIDLDAIRVDDVTPPQQHKERLEALMGEFVHQARDDAAGWKLQIEHRDVKAYVRTASKLGAFKGVGVINAHPYKVLQLILDISKRHMLDPQLLTKQRVHVYDQHTFVDHLVYKAVFPAAPRDFLNITHWRVLSDGSMLVIAASILDDDREGMALCPKQEPKIVRANAILGGFLLVPNADYTSVTATYILKADVKSGIPQIMQTKLFVKQAFVIDGIRKALDDEDEHEHDGHDQEDETILRKSSAYPRVTNKTHFALSVTDAEKIPLDDFEENADVETPKNSLKKTKSASRIESHPHSEYGVSSVPAEYEELIDKALARMHEELREDDTDSWQFHSEKHGIKSFIRVDGSLTSSKGVGFLPFPPRTIFDVAIDASSRKSVDPQLAFGGSLARLDAHTHIDYFEYKPVFVVAGRDFCNLAHWRVLPNGTIVIVAQSIEDLALCPLKEPKVVRGDIHIACWQIVPNADYSGAHVTFMVKTDLKGSIPTRITRKVAAEQPFILLRIAELLKKKTSFTDVMALGPMKNVGKGDTHTTSSHTKTKTTVSSKTHTSVDASKEEPEAEREASPSNKTTKAAEQHTGDKMHAGHEAKRAAPSNKNTPQVLATYAFQFVVALLALKSVALPGSLHYLVVLALVGWFALQVHLGPSNMSPRRKLMIASFGPPDSGMILGTLEIDVSKTQTYMAAKRQASGDHITMTHIVLRAMGVALSKAPGVNGHIVFGNYYPAPTVDISCLVAVDGGKDLGVSQLPSCDTMDLHAICAKLRSDASKLRSGNDQEQKDRNQLLNILPTYVIRPVTNLIGWLGGAVGIRIKPVGVEKYMFGACMVTSVGMLGLDLAFAPLTPYAQTPMLVTVGSIKDKAVVVDGAVAVRPILTITTTIDHRYVDGSEAARMANYVKQYVEDPALLEPVK
ncbi:Dihydrolipoyllysine-residue acetyltransferase component of pyruvate dehydrogenase complex, partial [Globisporangium splendens]